MSKALENRRRGIFFSRERSKRRSVDPWSALSWAGQTGLEVRCDFLRRKEGRKEGRKEEDHARQTMMEDAPVRERW